MDARTNLLANVERMRQQAAVCDQATLERILLQLDELERTVEDAVSEDLEADNCFASVNPKNEWELAEEAVKNWEPNPEFESAPADAPVSDAIVPAEEIGDWAKSLVQAPRQDEPEEDGLEQGQFDASHSMEESEDAAPASEQTGQPEADELLAPEDTQVDEAISQLQSRLGLDETAAVPQEKPIDSSSGEKLNLLREIANASADSALKIHQKKAGIVVLALRSSQVFFALSAVGGIVWLLTSILS